MGALQKIRNRAGLLIAALGFALLAFVLGDLFNSGGAWINKFKDKAFIVDGDVVSTGEYQTRVSQYEDFQRFVSGESSINENIRSQIGEFVYEQMVKEKILNGQAEKLGLAVTKEEINDMVYGQNISPVLLQSPIFSDPQTRQFNPDALMQFITFINTDINTVPDEQRPQLQMFKQQWLLIENMMKYHRLEEKYNMLLSTAFSVNEVEAKADYEASKSSANIAYVVNRYSSIPDSAVSVSDKEIEKLYNERKTNFKVNTELRKISYIVKGIEPSEADFAAVEREINTALEKLQTTENPALLVADYSEIPYRDVFFSESMLSPEEKLFAQTSSIGNTMGPIRDNNQYSLYKLIDKTISPDSVKMQLIVIPADVDAVAANAKADSILNVIKGGKGFAAVANELNPQSNGGELGWVTEPMLATAGEDFVKRSFKASKGDLFKVNSENVIQIVNITDVTHPVSKYKIALIQMPVVVSDKTLMDVDNELNKFMVEHGKANEFDKAATDKGYNLMPDMQIAPSNTGLPQVDGSRTIIHWAFNEKVGSVKKFDLADHRVIAVINEEIKAGYVPISDLKDYLKSELSRDKKAEKMIADLKAKNATSLDAYAQILNTKVDTVNFVKFTTPSMSALGREPMFNVYSEYAEVNKLQGPVKGNTGVYVLTVLNREVNPAPYDAVMTKQQLNRVNMSRFSSSTLFEVLKEKMNVVDNRVKFF